MFSASSLLSNEISLCYEQDATISWHNKSWPFTTWYFVLQNCSSGLFIKNPIPNGCLFLEVVVHSQRLAPKKTLQEEIDDLKKTKVEAPKPVEMNEKDDQNEKQPENVTKEKKRKKHKRRPKNE